MAGIVVQKLSDCRPIAVRFRQKRVRQRAVRHGYGLGSEVPAILGRVAQKAGPMNVGERFPNRLIRMTRAGIDRDRREPLAP